MSELKPGDRALVILPTECCGNPTMVGCSITVHELLTARVLCDYCGSLTPFFMRVHFGDLRTVAAHRLIRLPPDDEAKRLFRDTEKPREVSNV